MKPGIYTGMSNAEYRSVKAFSQSGFRYLKQSPAHYKHWLDNPTEPTKAMELGSALHCYILEPESFLNQYAEAPEGLDMRTKAGKVFAEETLGKKIISFDDLNRIKAMSEKFAQHPNIAAAVPDCQKEVSVFWKDPMTGVDCKARPDILTAEGLIIDLKTTDDASERSVMRSISTYHYHMQAAWYLAGVQTFLPEAKSFVFAFIEKDAPHEIGLYEFDYASLEKATAVSQELLRTYAKCLESNEYPGYSKGVVSINLPEYMW